MFSRQNGKKRQVVKSAQGRGCGCSPLPFGWAGSRTQQSCFSRDCQGQDSLDVAFPMLESVSASGLAEGLGLSFQKDLRVPKSPAHQGLSLGHLAEKPTTLTPAPPG